MSNDTPFEPPSLARWIAWAVLALLGLAAVLAVLLSQLEPAMRQAFLADWAARLRSPAYLLFLFIASVPLLVLAAMWYGLQSSMARDDLADDPRVRDEFKARFVHGDLEPGTKVVCANCGDVHDAMDVDCPECGASEIEG
ncbi:hypothetical protein [Natrinema pallidum]|uniref:Uncharacterized protein n=1 Tax=Natrinema pallidum TaxID=69527 RepID=A0A4P9TJU8_9EURY|nr:hypothetical protein [Natrinema pallidum]QCW05249.1 hypothetical protein FGF80_18545 [Natrinema pallidum]